MAEPTTNKTFHITVPIDEEDLAADRLWQLGVEAVGIGHPNDGVVELWTSVGATTASIERAVAVLEPEWTWRTHDVVAPQETWRDHVEPTWYSASGVVVPAWQSLAISADHDVLTTSIEPASSFGLGDHPTTKLTLGLLTEYLRSTSVSTLLDVGCGSGVLGIVAAQMGVASIRGTDVSAGAVEATKANAEINGVSDALEVDLATPQQLDGPYDVVVANILAPVLVGMAPELVRLIGSDGVLIISGILADDHQHVLDAVSPLRIATSRSAAGWISILLRR